MRTRPRPYTRALATASALALAATLSSCASGASESDDSLTLIDPWVKTAAADGMTAVFGTLENPTDADVTVTGASSDAAGMVELHEVVDGTMQEKDGGFTVPAGGELSLEPGGLHLMLMALPEDILAGEEITVTLELADGGTLEFTAPAKDFDGGNEDYEGDSMDADHGEMDMGSSADPSDG
ncbi:copper chaperone PCu(A)C [Demequina sp. SYSU T00068]|uniref:copper chaperone PCu(A)C n=1 Tax=Demequina lignilytica TaxID=3051663 RepID=UPI00262CF7E2|nr:copper chaperone PCu(A)C [Demequina sp. SYSU T00068]MDN4491340.1 copper chaperone PCu(A)C [Demequina sp. SYSU T00068]